MGRGDSHFITKYPRVKVAQTLFLEPSYGRALQGWALSSWSHLGLLGAIDFKEWVILVVTVIET